MQRAPGSPGAGQKHTPWGGGEAPRWGEAPAVWWLRAQRATEATAAGRAWFPEQKRVARAQRAPGSPGAGAKPRAWNPPRVGTVRWGCPVALIRVAPWRCGVCRGCGPASRSPCRVLSSIRRAQERHRPWGDRHRGDPGTPRSPPPPGSGRGSPGCPGHRRGPRGLPLWRTFDAAALHRRPGEGRRLRCGGRDEARRQDASRSPEAGRHTPRLRRQWSRDSARGWRGRDGPARASSPTPDGRI